MKAINLILALLGTLGIVDFALRFGPIVWDVHPFHLFTLVGMTVGGLLIVWGKQ